MVFNPRIPNIIHDFVKDEPKRVLELADELSIPFNTIVKKVRASNNSVRIMYGDRPYRAVAYIRGQEAKAKMRSNSELANVYDSLTKSMNEEEIAKITGFDQGKTNQYLAKLKRLKLVNINANLWSKNKYEIYDLITALDKDVKTETELIEEFGISDTELKKLRGRGLIKYTNLSGETVYFLHDYQKEDILKPAIEDKKIMKKAEVYAQLEGKIKSIKVTRMFSDLALQSYLRGNKKAAKEYQRLSWSFMPEEYLEALFGKQEDEADRITAEFGMETTLDDFIEA